MFEEASKINFDRKGNRLFLQHGPIDLFMTVEAESKHEEQGAYRLVASNFVGVLPELCDELSILRSPLSRQSAEPVGAIAKRMFVAASSHAESFFVTPMIAVAGSIADHIVELVAENFDVNRVFVNNGGDIALHMAQDETFSVGICSDVGTGEIGSYVTINGFDGIGGIATSGWKGRSHSLGIADSVTALAHSSAAADAAATLIANVIDIPGSDKVTRVSAEELSPDSDLAGRLVTTNVSLLSKNEKREALEKGARLANQMKEAGLIHSAFLSLQGESLIVEHSKKSASAETDEIMQNSKPLVAGMHYA